MKIMQYITIGENGAIKTTKDKVDDCRNHESFVCGIMCWYSTGTKFVVKDTSDGEIQVFAKVGCDDTIRGYSELVRLANFTKLDELFKLLETEI